MHGDLFAKALGVSEPWFVDGVDFDEGERRLTVRIDFRRGSRFAHAGDDGAHPVHDTQIKRYRHLDFFQHECLLEVRVPRVRLPDRRVALVKPPWSGRLSGFTLLYEALILAMCQEMTFAAVARLTGVSWHRVHARGRRKAFDQSAIVIAESEPRAVLAGGDDLHFRLRGQRLRRREHGAGGESAR